MGLNIMEKSNWIKEIEKDFNVSFFGSNCDSNVVYFENDKNVFWVVKIDMNEKSISVFKPSNKYRNLKLAEKNGLKFVEELLKHIDHWNDLGLVNLFHLLDKISVKRQIDKIDRWIFTIESRVSENAFGGSDWAEF